MSTPNDPNDPSEHDIAASVNNLFAGTDADLLGGAVACYRTYVAFHQAGFTTPEALYLTAEILKASINGGGSANG